MVAVVLLAILVISIAVVSIMRWRLSHKAQTRGHMMPISMSGVEVSMMEDAKDVS